MARTASAMLVSQATASFSPRLGVVVDPIGDQKWSRHRRASRSTSPASRTPSPTSSSPGGNFDSYAVRLRRAGHQRRSDGPTSRRHATMRSQQLFAWFECQRRRAGLPPAAPPTVRGVTPQIRGSLKSPNAWEYSTGVNRQFGARASVRADVHLPQLSRLLRAAHRSRRPDGSPTRVPTSRRR